MSKRKPKGTPTSLNIWVLARHFNGATEATSRVASTSAPHLRRCLKAGLCEASADRGRLVLTEAGIAAVKGVK